MKEYLLTSLRGLARKLLTVLYGTLSELLKKLEVENNTAPDSSSKDA